MHYCCKMYCFSTDAVVFIWANATLQDLSWKVMLLFGCMSKSQTDLKLLFTRKVCLSNVLQYKPSWICQWTEKGKRRFMCSNTDESKYKQWWSLLLRVCPFSLQMPPIDFSQSGRSGGFSMPVTQVAEKGLKLYQKYPVLCSLISGETTNDYQSHTGASPELKPSWGFLFFSLLQLLCSVRSWFDI